MATFPQGVVDYFVANAAIASSSRISLFFKSDPGAQMGAGTVQWIELHPGSGFTIHLNTVCQSSMDFDYVDLAGAAIVSPWNRASGTIFQLTPGDNLEIRDSLSSPTFRVEAATGNVQIDGKLTVDGAIDPTWLALTPQSSAPVAPVEGQMYYDSTLVMFRFYENGVWDSIAGENLWDRSGTILTTHTAGDSVRLTSAADFEIYNAAGTPIKVFDVDGATGATNVTGQLTLGVSAPVVATSYTTTVGNTWFLRVSPSALSTANIFRIEANGGNWTSGAKVLELVSENDNAINLAIHDGANDQLTIDRYGTIRTNGQILSETGVNETATRLSIKQAATSGTQNTLVQIWADGTFFSPNSVCLKLISDTNNCNPLVINNGVADIFEISRNGFITMAAGDISMAGGSIITGNNNDITLAPNGFGVTVVDVNHDINAFLIGNSTEVGYVSNATSNGTAMIWKSSHGLSVSPGDLLHITDATTSADEGFYRVVSTTLNSFDVDRALTGSDSDVDFTIWKDVISFFDTDGTNGNWFRGNSHQDKPLQIGGDILIATSHSLGSEDVLIGSLLEVKKDAHFDGRILSEAGVNELTARMIIKQTPTSSIANIIMQLDANGTNWTTGSRVLKIISDDDSALPLVINNGAADTAYFRRDGALVTAGDLITGGTIELSNGDSIITTVDGDITLAPHGTGIIKATSTLSVSAITYLNGDMSIGPVTTATGIGNSISVFAANAAGAGNDAGGVVSLYGGSKTGSGTWGYVRIGSSGVPNNIADFATNDYLFVNGMTEFGNSVWFEGPQLIGSPPVITDAQTDEFFLSVSQTINDPNAPGGSDVYRMFKGTITETDVTGLNDIYFIDFSVGPAPVFIVRDGVLRKNDDVQMFVNANMAFEAAGASAIGFAVNTSASVAGDNATSSTLIGFGLSVEGHAGDTNRIYVGHGVDDFVSNGGSPLVTMAWSVGDNWDYALFANSGDIGFTDYTPTFWNLSQVDIAAATEKSSIIFNSTAKTWVAGAGPLAAQRDWQFLAGIYNGNVGDPLTITDSATVYISGAPTQGTNITLTNTYSFWIDSGPARFDGTVNQGKGNDIASANDMILGYDGNYFDITGAVQINRIAAGSYTNGTIIVLQFDGAPTVKYNQAAGGGFSSILLAGAGDFAASAGSTLVLIRETTAWREISRTVI